MNEPRELKAGLDYAAISQDCPVKEASVYLVCIVFSVIQGRIVPPGVLSVSVVYCHLVSYSATWCRILSPSVIFHYPTLLFIMIIWPQVISLFSNEKVLNYVELQNMTAIFKVAVLCQNKRVSCIF